jgi:hypothetical protein
MSMLGTNDRKRLVAWLIAFTAICSLAAPFSVTTANADLAAFVDSFDADRAWAIVNDLAGPRFEGRRAGTKGADLASEYIADYFDSLDLKPAGDGGTYMKRFTLPLWQLTEIPNLTLVNSSQRSVSQSFEYRRDFNVIPGSGGGIYSAEVVFAGYGITAERIGYDDYANITATGKIVLAIVGTPPSDRFGVGDYAASYVKAENAISHGAVGLILVDTPAQPTKNYVERRRCGCCWTIYEKLIILAGSVEMADTLLKDNSLTLATLQRTINDELKPRSFSTSRQLRVSVHVTFDGSANAQNVLGFIPGTDPGSSKRVIIIGAHYDHWGRDVDWSMYSGGNDNASGVAVMMEIARVFSSGAKPNWSVLFAAWSGEEEGFYGSRDYAHNPYFPLSGTIAYVNLDMVGFGQPLLGQVSESYKHLRLIAMESANELDISVNFQDYQGGSDSVPFEEKGVPNLTLIYWPDDTYHTPADTADHVSKENLRETGRLAALITLKLSQTAGTGTDTLTIAALVITGVVIVALVAVFRRQRSKKTGASLQA